MVELAPHHKIGLPLSGPVMIASGFGGYGDACRPLINLSNFGAVVTQPITLRPQRGQAQPRLAETQGGFILNTGQQNPGVKKVINRYRKIWPGLNTVVIAHLPAAEPDDLRRTARALSGIQTPQGESIIAAIELGLPHHVTGWDVEQWIRAIHQGSKLPLLVKLPLNSPPDIAEAAARVNADALVAGAPLSGAAFNQTGQMVTGPLYGPAAHSLTLHSLKSIADVGLPLVAAGGIHSRVDAQHFFDAGASAIQLDAVLFADPQLAEDIAAAF